MLTKYEVDKPFPGAFPKQEGVVMELSEGGLMILIQMPNLSRQEKQAFKKSFKRYSFLEVFENNIPIPIWSFDFPDPFGAIDVNFNARPVKPEYIKNFLEFENGRPKNALDFFLLDGNILKAAKRVGLQEEAVLLFQESIKKQLTIEYTDADYAVQIVKAYQLLDSGFIKKGKIFKHKGKKL